MNKKTVYDELLGYKVKPQDVKPISELFIELQEHQIPISLKDLLFFYNKKINFNRFKLLISEALDNNLDIPVEKLKKVNLTGNDFLNLIAGIVSAEKEKLEIKISDIEYFAKMKINIPELLESLKKINEFAPDIVLNDFAHCQNCLYESKNFVNQLIELKKFSPDISLKQIISLSFKKDEAPKILSLYKRLKHYHKWFSLNDIIGMKTEGIEVLNFLNGLLLAEKYEIHKTPKRLYDIARKQNDFKHIILENLQPDNIILKPVRIILKSGMILMLKVSYRLFADLEHLLEGMSKPALAETVKNKLNEAAKQYDSVKEFLIDAPQIAQETEKAINTQKPAYRIQSLSILDFIIERSIAAEQEQAVSDFEKRKFAEEEFKKEHTKTHSQGHKSDEGHAH